MKYAVVWSPSAEQELARLWLKATDRSVVTQAAFQIDHLLEAHPGERGESRSAGRRILIEPPLGVTFEVLDSPIVRVLTVWRFDQHR